jgi:hypothetical protein
VAMPGHDIISRLWHCPNSNIIMSYMDNKFQVLWSIIQRFNYYAGIILTNQTTQGFLKNSMFWCIGPRIRLFKLKKSK